MLWIWTIKNSVVRSNVIALSRFFLLNLHPSHFDVLIIFIQLMGIFGPPKYTNIIFISYRMLCYDVLCCSVLRQVVLYIGKWQNDENEKMALNEERKCMSKMKGLTKEKCFVCNKFGWSIVSFNRWFVVCMWLCVFVFVYL